MSVSLSDFRRIKAKSQRLIDDRRERQNKLLPRDVSIPASSLQLDPIAARASVGAIVIRDGEIVKVLPPQNSQIPSGEPLSEIQEQDQAARAVPNRPAAEHRSTAAGDRQEHRAADCW